jgi:radical SAM protein with 4Fe4S-binding SPASM domain
MSSPNDLAVDMPLFDAIQVQTHTRCNMQCSFCPHGKIPIQHGDMDDGTFEKVARQLGAVGFAGTIYPYLMNEPMMDPRLPERVARLRQACPQARIWIDTNGTLATVELLAGLVAAGATTITVEIYLPPGRGIPERHLRLCRDLPPDARRCVFLYERAADAVLTNRAGNLPDRPTPERPLPLPCERPFRQVYVAYDGSLLLCCQDWSREAILGNLHERPMAEIWRMEAYAEIRRRLLRSDRDMNLCRRCDYAGRPSEMPGPFRSRLPVAARTRWRAAWAASAWRDVFGNRMLLRYCRSWFRRRVLGRVSRRS